MAKCNPPDFKCDKHVACRKAMDKVVSRFKERAAKSRELVEEIRESAKVTNKDLKQWLGDDC